MRSVRNSVRVVRNAPELDSLSTHEFARSVIQHLVGIHVRVIVGRRYRVGIEVVRARTERTHHEAVAFEGLMHRWRLMHSTNDRLEVVDVERPRIEVAVPADDVEWVVVENE